MATSAHEETITVPLPMAEAYQRSLSATDALKRAKVDQSDEQAGVVELKVGISFKSWGERVRIELSPEGEGSTRAHVASRAALKTTMADYGKNRDNVQRVTEWLRSGAPAAA